MTIGDGCDDYFGSGGGIKNTVTIVTTVTHPKTHPPSPALNPQIGSRTVDGSGAVREYGNAGVHAAADDVVHRQQRPRLPQEPHSPFPPRRAHDTLQPQDESIIVGYYTSEEVLPRSLRFSKI